MNKGYQHIILVTDGSKTSRSAEETAVHLATQHKAKVIIVDTVRPPSFASQWLTSNSKELFDVIISDSTDPIGPGGALFTSDFYTACKKCLKPDGILVTQNGVAFMQPDEVSTTYKRLQPHFKDHTFYSAAIPTYIGGIMTFAWGTDNTQARQLQLETLQQRYQAANIKTRYYNPAIHLASFALPQYVLDTIEH